MKIIASDITNLTDARYFAAWNIDFLAYHADNASEKFVSPEQINAIAEWVEGPDTVLIFNGLSVPENAKEIIESTEAKTAIIGPYIEQNDIKGIETIYRICTLDALVENENAIVFLNKEFNNLTTAETEAIKALASVKEVYLDGIFSPTDLPTLTEMGVTGVVVKGGEEEKVGVKSFDDLDELLEGILEMSWG